MFRRNLNFSENFVLEHSDPPFRNEFVIKVTNVLFLLFDGFGCVDPAECHNLLQK